MWEAARASVFFREAVMRATSLSFGVLMLTVGLLAAAPAFAGACTGKVNGLWCDGNNLVNCQGGNVASSQSCPNGCQSMPDGVPDQCKAAAGFCSGKQNGLWCDGDKLVNCQGGAVASSQACANGCQSMPVGTPDACKAAAGFCGGKQNGKWCDGDKLVNCQGGAVASSQTCDNGCESMPVGTPDQCKPGTTPTGPCSSKSDGKWCDGSKLLTCKGGNVSSSQDCGNGCQSMPAGTSDQCKSDPTPTGFCSSKTDGAWCDGNALQQCKSGQTTSSQDCKNGCQSMPAGTPDQCKADAVQPTFCTGKADGPWCDGTALRSCQNGAVASSADCPAGCQTNPAGTPDACKPKPIDGLDPCKGKADGAYCLGAQLVECFKGNSQTLTPCPNGCLVKPPGTPDVCAPAATDDCTMLPDGQWCSDVNLLKCKNKQLIAAMSCAQGCLAMGGKGSAVCKATTTGFCGAKTNGDWCDGELLTTCSSGKTSKVVPCSAGCQTNPPGTADACAFKVPNPPPSGEGGLLTPIEYKGCATFTGFVDLWKDSGLPVWDQKDPKWGGDQLGTCPGLTIHNSGCTITSLSMMHNLLDLTRTIGSESGNDPGFENKWRKAESGGYGTTDPYPYGGKMVTGDCLVAWSEAAGGLVPHDKHNDSKSCLTQVAAQFIANSLNAGMPVVAGVHWPENPSQHDEAENWHWVLVVGADKDGLILNDPWGGKERVRLSQGGLGSYTVDTLYTFWSGGNGNGNFKGAALDEMGVPRADEDLPNSLPILGQPQTQPDAGATDTTSAPVYGSPSSGSCTASPMAPLGGWLVGFAVMVVVLVMRRRRAS